MVEGAAVERGAVEVAGAVQDERSVHRPLTVRWVTGKTVQHREAAPVGLHREDGALVRRAAAVGRAVEVAVGVKDQSGVRAGPVGDASRKVVQDG